MNLLTTKDTENLKSQKGQREAAEFAEKSGTGR